jgi:hypothetical protein
MDLRPFVRNSADIEEARCLIASGNFTYQPFIIADDLEVGAGYTFVTRNPHAGLVHWPGYEAARHPSGILPSRLIKNGELPDFRSANDGTRQVYEGFLDQLCDNISDRGSKSLIDIGCYNGYIPVSASKCGFARSLGYDLDDRSACFAFLNRVLGTNAEFVHRGYDIQRGTIENCPTCDIVVSMSVIQHMPEPIRHLAFLRSITGEALLLVTCVWDDDELLIRFGEPNQIFNNCFPWCFDNSMYMTERLLRLCLAKAGFHRVIELETRFPTTVSHAPMRGTHDYATADAAPAPSKPSLRSFVTLSFC